MKTSTPSQKMNAGHGTGWSQCLLFIIVYSIVFKSSDKLTVCYVSSTQAQVNLVTSLGIFWNIWGAGICQDLIKTKQTRKTENIDSLFGG